MSSSSRLRSFTDRHRLLGPVIWVATVEYFVVQYVVASQWPTPYSLLRNPISDLGNTSCGVYDGRPVCSPQYRLMNLAFMGLGLLIAVGAPLIHQEFRERRLARLGFCGMVIAGLGTVLVGLSPENVNHTFHVIGAAGPFLVGNIALIILACTLTMSMSVRLLTGIAGGVGLVGLIGLLLFSLGVDIGLGQGGVERVAAYPQSIWLIVFGLYMSMNHYVKRRRTRRELGLGGSAA
ncbi:MAG TPA: DUF998 domain-containing protein [Solirubrobacteraceae bacterium]|nr:DUF998 domain-containing protein [Solirubrobacteraceae bacterium]